MTKQESMIMKGVAILFMIFGHLFFHLDEVESLTDPIAICGLPFSYILTRATGPVAFFLMLSGYGLYISHHKGNYNVLSKLKGLYLHYWLTLLVFVTLGYFIVGAKIYPGGLYDVIGNATGWEYTYNAETWFLFPYILVMLTSKWIVKVLDRYNAWICVGVTFFLSMCTGYLISRHGAQYLFGNMLLYKPVLYVQFLFPFTLGAYMAKFQIVNKCKIGGGKTENAESRYNNYSWLYWALLVALVAFRCCFETGAFHTLYVFAFIILFANAPRPKVLDGFLAEMGKRSTSMWFIHTYFCYYLFHDFIYGFKYPVLIFAVLLVCSYMSAVVIDWMNGKVQKMIRRK